MHRLCELAGIVPVHHQSAEQMILTQQRHRHERPVTQPEDNLPEPALVAGIGHDVANLRRLTGRRHPSERTLALPDWARPAVP